MNFIKTSLDGEWIVKPEIISDNRGYFARLFSEEEFENKGLNTKWLQNNMFYSKVKGTLRGLTYQQKPFEEEKLIICTKGSIFDVAVDIRPDSSTFRKYTNVILSSKNKKMHYIPKGFAHGYMTLEDDTKVIYLSSESYEPEAGRGIKWDDPDIAIDWPINIKVISEKDNSYPYLK